MGRVSRGEALARLRRHLAIQGYAPQDRLPPERVLAPLLGLSRMTLRACLHTLETEGLVWRHVGQGTFYGSREVERGTRIPLLIEMTSAADLMDARLIIEPEIAAAAAVASTAEQLARLSACVAAGRAASGLHQCEWADRRFHSALARATRNPVLAGILEFLSGARGRAAWQRQWNRTYGHIGAAEFRGAHSDHHAAIIEAIRCRDPDAARTAMRHHLTVIHHAMQGTTDRHPIEKG